MTFLAQVPFEVVGVLVLVGGVLMAMWSLAGIQEALHVLLTTSLPV